jgi:HPt (histidine-containing phosphotransfer) domain-containing protein
MDEIVVETSRPASAETLDRSVIGQFRESDTAALPDFALVLIEQFVLEAESQVELLRNAGQRGDPQALKSAAHCLKGSSLTMGATRLGALCARIETHAADFAGGGATDLMREVDQEFIKVRNALAAER